jgi:hypothetical protein
VGLEHAHRAERGHGQRGAAGAAEMEQRRSGTRKKKEKKEMVTDRWGRAEGMTEKEGNDCEKKK